MDESVTITLGRAEALTIFDPFARLREGSAPIALDEPERAACAVVEGCLEEVLVEPFMGDYARILQEARRQVLAKWGAIPRPDTGQPDPM